MSLISGYPFDVFASAYDAVTPNLTPPLSLERIYITGSQNWGSSFWTDIAPCIAAGRTPIVSAKLNGSWASAATGSNDARFDTAFTQMFSINITGLPIKPYFCWHHEAEGNGTPADFNAMYRHMMTRYAAQFAAEGWGLCYIALGGTFSGFTQWSTAQLEAGLAGTGITNLFADVYEKPGGGNFGGYSDPSKTWMQPSDPNSYFSNYFDYCRAHGYTAALPEFGINQWQNDPTGLKAGAFIQALSQYAPSQDALFYIYYDRVIGEGGATSQTAITHGGVLTGPSSSALTSFSHLYNPSTPAGPIISSFFPTIGAPGTSVTILGSGFNGATRVTFGTQPAAFSVVSATQITAIVPPTALTGTVQVFTPAGTATSAGTFTVGSTPPPPGGFVPGVISPMFRVRQAAG